MQLERELVERLKQHVDFHPIHLEALQIVAQKHLLGKSTEHVELKQLLDKSPYFESAREALVPKVEKRLKKSVSRQMANVRINPELVYKEIMEEAKTRAKDEVVLDTIKLLKKFKLIEEFTEENTSFKIRINKKLEAEKILKALKTDVN